MRPSLILCTAAAAASCQFEEGFDFAGNDLKTGESKTKEDCCAECTKTTGCNAFTLWEGGPTCFLKINANGRKAFPGHVSAVIPTGPTPPPTPFACTSDLECSLNGVCTAGQCKCDKPWSGASCETMNLKPVTFPQGYGQAPNVTTWGGGAVFDAATKKYHIYASRMTNGCLLKTWGHNSRIDHGISDTITGPYTFKDVAVNTWAHNAAPITLHDGTYAIVHIGTGEGGPDGGQNCTKPGTGAGAGAGTDEEFPTFQEYRASTTAGSTIHVSKSVDGPWTPLSPNTLGGCNNPAPWVHPNGTIYIVCGGSFKRADHISGPWSTVSSFSHAGGPAGNWEDPYLYTDHRGHFHLIYHVYNTHENPPHGHECFNSTVSAHQFSTDGYTWHSSATSPYGTQVKLTTGETITVATRERPKLFFDANGRMTHLFNGVCSAPNCPNGPATGCVDCKYDNWDYTLVQPLDLD